MTIRIWTYELERIAYQATSPIRQEPTAWDVAFAYYAALYEDTRHSIGAVLCPEDTN